MALRAMVCEMCQGNDLIKQDGVYVCQHCGTKYSVEEARKLFVEGIIKVDHSDEIKNLYEVARRARDEHDNERARKYYEMILAKDPSSWEANFYAVYHQAMLTSIAGIRKTAILLRNYEDTVLTLIKENVADPHEQRTSVDEIGAKLIDVSQMLFSAARNHYIDIGNKHTAQYMDSAYATMDILYRYGDHLIQFFGEAYGDTAASCWKVAIQQHTILTAVLLRKDKNVIQEYAKKIQQYDPSYQAPTPGGCYIATAVYGSYDCPQVWTLRRFRDDTLSKNRYGRAFTCIYYTVSPILVKRFGKAEWFKNLWMPILDRIVENLNKQGIANTPYSKG